jgi:hypothetical protein
VKAAREGGHRQDHGEDGAAVLLAADKDPAAALGDDAPGDAQSQPGALALLFLLSGLLLTHRQILTRIPFRRASTGLGQSVCPRFGFWRPYIMDVIHRYLDCGDQKCGFARVKMHRMRS